MRHLIRAAVLSAVGLAVAVPANAAGEFCLHAVATAESKDRVRIFVIDQNDPAEFVRLTVTCGYTDENIAPGVRNIYAAQSVIVPIPGKKSRIMSMNYNIPVFREPVNVGASPVVDSLMSMTLTWEIEAGIEKKRLYFQGESLKCDIAVEVAELTETGGEPCTRTTFR